MKIRLMKCAKRIQIGKSKYTTLEIAHNNRNSILFND
jgi:hypothetical protein